MPAYLRFDCLDLVTSSKNRHRCGRKASFICCGIPLCGIHARRCARRQFEQPEKIVFPVLTVGYGIAYSHFVNSDMERNWRSRENCSTFFLQFMKTNMV